MIRTATPTRERILQSATTLFSRYGYKRTSMEDIATDAGLSRAALYLQFRNKEDIFRALSTGMHAEAMSRVAAALTIDEPLGERLLHALEAKTLRVLEVAYASPHGGELMDENNRLCGDLATENHIRFVAMLAEAFAQGDADGVIDLAKSRMTAQEIAETFTQAAAGLKLGGVSPGVYRRRLRAFVVVFMAGLAA